MPLLPKWIGKPSTPRDRTAIPITQPTNHRNEAIPYGLGVTAAGPRLLVPIETSEAEENHR